LNYGESRKSTQTSKAEKGSNGKTRSKKERLEPLGFGRSKIFRIAQLSQKKRSFCWKQIILKAFFIF